MAASGGRDSTALLHATCRAASALGVDVVALHVHHGLSPNAEGWVAHLQRQCARWARNGVPLRMRWQRLEGAPPRGDSIEGWARRGRYNALAQMAQEEGASLVLLAQHRRDQAETVLLQALRAAGPPGLAAMPRQKTVSGVVFMRPWLDRTDADIDAYVQRWRLSHIEDDSNADVRYARNRLRHKVWPALIAAFPDAEVALSGLARRAQEAAAVLAEVTAADLAACTNSTGDATKVGAMPELHLPPWRALTPPRRAGVLRAWLQGHYSGGVPDSLVSRLAAELPEARSGCWPAEDGAQLHAHRGRLRWVAAPSAKPIPADPSTPHDIDLSRPGRYPVPAWHGTLVVDTVDQGGLCAKALQHAQLRPRSGGERFQLGPSRPPRSLKKQYQSAALSTRERSGPLVYLDGALAFVPGLGVDARQLAAPGKPQRQLTWLPHPPPQ